MNIFLRWKKLNPTVRRVAIISVIAFSIGFPFYIHSLYIQLNEAFSKQEEFIPTRIYSDVTKITNAVPREYVSERLETLGYTVKNSEDSIAFTLHTIDYPTELLPYGTATSELTDQSILLHFDSSEKDALLHSIEVGGREIPEVYLEPELVATFSRAGVAGPSQQIRAIVKFENIPEAVWKSIIAIEDPHFLEHGGFEFRAIARAIWIDLKTHSLKQGGSTITQQLVKNLMARRGKNIFRKVNELFLSLLLESKFSKEQILERYLNEVDLGQIGNLEIHGVQEGAEHYFGKKIDDLNLAESALMAGMIKSAVYYSPYKYRERAMERQRLVLKRMVETGQIAQEEANAAEKEPIHLSPPQTILNKAPYFSDFVKAELIRKLKGVKTEDEIAQAGFKIYTTLDMSMNSAAQKAVAAGVTEIQARIKLPPTDQLEGALASVDQSTGYVRALIGGTNYSKSTFNRILNMKRQVGSTFKPFVYLTAYSIGNDPQGVPYSPGHPAEDAPWKLIYDRGKQIWEPKNYEKEFMGWISFRTALAHSINTVGAKLGFEVGIGNVIKTARALGIESDLPNVPSLSLGVAELSPVELLKAYGAIANHGVQDWKDQITVIRGIYDDRLTQIGRYIYRPVQVFERGPIDLLTDTLQNVFTEGTAHFETTRLGFDRPAAGKTGTTSNHRDSWFAGYTPQLTTVVWVGLDQDDPKIKMNLTGSVAALPIWINFMKKALVTEAPQPFPISPELVDLLIDRHSGKIAAPYCTSDQVTTEKFLKTHVPSSVSCDPGYPEAIRETVAN